MAKVVKKLKKEESKKEEPKKKVKVESPRLELTEKEIEVGQLLWEGYTTKEIAEMLENSSRTIEVHIMSMYTKLNAIKQLKNNNSMCLVRELLERGLIK